MIIEFTVDENDFLTHQLYMASKSERIKKKRQRSALTVPLLYLAFGLFMLYEKNFITATLFITVAIAWYFIYPFWEKRRYFSHYRDFIRENYKDRFGKTTMIEFGDDFIFAKDPGSESRVMTTEIEEINEIPTTIFIRLKSGHSFLLPKEKIKNIEVLRDKLKMLAASLNINYNSDDKWEWK